MNVSPKWSSPNADGVRTLTIGFGVRASLHGQRFRRKDEPEVEGLKAWPHEWRELLREWLKSDTERTRWNTLLKIAGPLRVSTADELLTALLRAGFAEVDERRDRARWVVAWVRFLNSDLLRPVIGLPDAVALEQELLRLRSRPLSSMLIGAAASLSDFAPPIAIRRLQLLHRLDDWISAGYHGTRRDFALFATGETKGVPDSDWAWLDGILELENLGVEQHVPLILLRAPIALQCSSPLDLRGIADCVGLSPTTIESVSRIEGGVKAWRLVENRTLFDRVARQYGPTDGIAWIPGYPPEWWRRAIAHLLRQLPERVRIACDPDPSGIRIALQVGQVCKTANVQWSSWGMNVPALESLPAYLPLSDEDAKMLQDLLQEDLPHELHHSARWMLERRLKGEQEGLSSTVLEKAALEVGTEDRGLC